MDTFSTLLALCEGSSPVTGEFPSQRPKRGALMFSLIRIWSNGWANHWDASDFRHHHAHYDITVMSTRPGWESPLLSEKYAQSKAKFLGGIIGQGQHGCSMSSRSAWVVIVIEVSMVGQCHIVGPTTWSKKNQQKFKFYNWKKKMICDTPPEVGWHIGLGNDSTTPLYEHI